MPVLNSPFDPKGLFGNLNFGPDIDLSVRLPIMGGSSLFAYSRPALIIGSEPYLKALNTDKHFWLWQHTFGLDIPSVARFGVLLPATSSISAFESDTWKISFQISPENVLANKN